MTCGVEPLMAMAELPGPYDFQAYAVRARGVTTNTCPMAPYRGVSRPAITLAMERLMDCAAARSAWTRSRSAGVISSVVSVQDRDRPDLRRRLVSQTLELAVERIDVAAFRERQRAARADGRYLGIGFAVFNERTGYGTPAFAARGMDITPGYERVEMAMDPSGFVEARIGASPHGQGLATTLAQLVADQLGLEPTRIRIVHGDTDARPMAGGRSPAARWSSPAAPANSRPATAGEARASRRRSARSGGLRHRARRRQGGRARHGSRDRDTDPGARGLPSEPSFGRDLDPELSVSATYDPAGTYSNACHVAVVEVDPETGHVALERFLVVEDAGRLINPMIVNGQICGGVAQGIANALVEEVVYDAAGNILTGSLADYLPPTCAEIPPIEIVHLETTTEHP